MPLTRQATLNAVWDKNPSSDYSRITEIFRHYANPTRWERFFHLGRTQLNQTMVNSVLAQQNIALQSPEALLAAICVATFTRNPEGELEHRINYINEKMDWHIANYLNDSNSGFSRRIDAQIQTLATSDEAADLDRMLRLQQLSKMISSDSNQFTNRVIISSPKSDSTANQIIGIGYHDTSDRQFKFVPVFSEVAPAPVPSFTS